MLVIDSFAGGGGASLGISQAIGRSPDIAINHNPFAIAMHAANHPDTLHLTENVWQVNIETHTKGAKVGLLWASPDCRHFSKARGGAPVSKSVRGLAWSVVRFVHDLGPNAPDLICLENVEEFLTWEEFPAWRRELRRYGYKLEHRELRACDYGAPTIRKRLFIVLRRDGRPIVWPAPTHGDPKSEAVRARRLKPWRTAAEIIDWSLPCPSIFASAEEIMAEYGVRAVRPLAENTLKRIAAGVMRYVVNAKEPFFVSYGQQGGANRSAADPLHTVTASKGDCNTLVTPFVTKFRANSVGQPLGEPLHTVTANSWHKRPGGAAPLGVVVPTMVHTGYGEREGQAPRVPGLEKPLGTVVAGGGKHALVAAFLAQHNTGVVGHAAREPVSTIVGKGSTQNVVAAHLMTMRNAGKPWSGMDEPAHTITAGGAHLFKVAAFLTKYYGNWGDPPLTEPLHTVTTRDRFGLVTVTIEGEEYVITDIGMRMLTPRELFRAQGFGDDYIIDRTADGTPMPKTEQIHKCGNSVCPPVVRALVAANWPGEIGEVAA